MALESVKIPQNVYVEDRIFGPITLKQLVLCLLGGGLSYAIWSSMKAAGHVSILSTSLSWTPLIIAAAFAFVKINGITLFRLCLLIIEKSEKPSTRIFSPRRGLEINVWTSSTQKSTELPPGDPKHAERIQELSSLLDKGPDEELDDIASMDSVNQPHLKAAMIKPVQRDRIAVDATANRPAVDSVGTVHAKMIEPVSETPLLRDIQPPKQA